MAEPTGTLTFQELVKRVAELSGCANYADSGQGVALIPIDPHDLDKCKRVVNDAIRMFIADGPAKGWRWMRRLLSVTFDIRVIKTGTADSGSATTLVDAARTEASDYFNGWTLEITAGTGIGQTAVITDFDSTTTTLTFGTLATPPDNTSVYSLTPDSRLNIGDDPARSLLPSGFGGSPDGPIAYAKSSGYGTRIDWTDEGFIRERRALGVSVGIPMFAAIVPYEPTTAALTTSRKWELLVDPQPAGEYTVEFPYTLYFDDMQLEAGTATTGSVTTLADPARLEADDYFNGWTIRIIDGTGVGQSALVTNYTGATGTFEFAAITTAPGATSVYMVTPPANLHPAGQQYDNAILWACKAMAETQFENVMGNYMEYYRKVALPGAQALDVRSAPRKLGNTHVDRDRYWNIVTYTPRS